MASTHPVDHSHGFDAACDIANVMTTDDDTTHYLEDPDMFADNLPQPFRRIDRILNSIIDNVLEIAQAHVSKMIHDVSRRQAPMYDSANILEVLMCFVFLFFCL